MELTGVALNMGNIRIWMFVCWMFTAYEDRNSENLYKSDVSQSVAENIDEIDKDRSEPSEE